MASYDPAFVMLIRIRELKGARNPVGWTHEDIDGLFGKTTPLCRKRDILTPKQVGIFRIREPFRREFNVLSTDF